MPNTDANNVEIVLVEDNPNDIELTLRALRKHNIANKIQVLRDGDEAINFLFRDPSPAEHPPKVILLDVKLPKITGLEILRKIKADPRLKTVPVVMLTSSQEEKDIVESYQLGVNSYIVKPIDFSRFADSIAQLGLYWLLLNRSPF